MKFYRIFTVFITVFSLQNSIIFLTYVFWNSWIILTNFGQVSIHLGLHLSYLGERLNKWGKILKNIDNFQVILDSSQIILDKFRIIFDKVQFTRSSFIGILDKFQVIWDIFWAI